MRSRLLAATVAALLAATPAFAESERRPKRPSSCGLSDPAGDVPSGAFDITCAALGVGRKTVVGLLRVEQLDDEPLYDGAAGATWTLTFAVGKTEYAFRRIRTAGATPRYTYDFGGKLVAVTLTDTEIRWTARSSDVPGLSRGRPRLVSATTSGLVSKDEARSPR